MEQNNLQNLLDSLDEGPLGRPQWQIDQSVRQLGVKMPHLHTKKVRKQASKSSTGQKRPNTSLAMLGVPKSEQAKQNMRKPKSGGSAKGTRKPHKFVPVDKFSLDGNYIETYPSIIDAVNNNNVSRPNITGALAGRQNTAGGFIWKYSK